MSSSDPTHAPPDPGDDADWERVARRAAAGSDLANAWLEVRRLRGELAKRPAVVPGDDAELRRDQEVIAAASPDNVGGMVAFKLRARDRWPAALDALAVERATVALLMAEGSAELGRYLADVARMEETIATLKAERDHLEDERDVLLRGVQMLERSAVTYRDERDAARREVDRFAAAVPKSHDGVTIVPDMTLWSAYYAGVFPVVVTRVGTRWASFSDATSPRTPLGTKLRPLGTTDRQALFADRAAADAWYAANRERINAPAVSTVPDPSPGDGGAEGSG